jgi:hypothetical protein
MPIALLALLPRGFDLDSSFHRVENHTLASLQPGQHLNLAAPDRFAQTQLAQAERPSSFCT